MLRLVDQMELYDSYSVQVLDELVNFLQEHRGEILIKARERMRSGFKEYGDLMWTWDDTTRTAETIEEIADALNYQISGVVSHGEV